MAKTILTGGQQRLLRVLALLAGFLVANAAYLYLSPPHESVLPVFYQWMLVAHVVVGMLLLVPMTWFVLWHLRRALAMRNRRAVSSGLVVTGVAVALAVTGLFIMSQSNSEANRWAFLSHRLLALAAPLGYALHRAVARYRPERRTVVRAVAAPALVLGALLLVHHGTLPEAPPVPQALVERPEPGVDPFKDSFPDHGPGGADPESVFFPASTRSVTGEFLPRRLLTNADLATREQLEKDIEEHGFAVNARIGSETCARCHPDVVEQWARSAHRFASFNNPFYRASIEALRTEEDGRRRSQWCAGCHDPAIMMAGNMIEDIEPTAPESQAGLTCMACHAMESVHGLGGNANYRIEDGSPEPYLFADAKEGLLAEVHDLLVRAKPDVHKREMLKPVFRTEEYCATCHKVSLDTPVNGYRWLRGQDEYDAHQDSGVSRNNARTFYLPPESTSCQDCHMPLVPAPLGDLSAKGGMVRSHLFPAANTALPHVRGDQETVREIEQFMSGTLRVDVLAVRREDGTLLPGPDLRDIPLTAGETVEFQVVVRNQGVGHTFPGGTLDSNEAWIHLVVHPEGEPGRVLAESGRMDPETRRVDEAAHVYSAVFVDEHGVEAALRNPQDFRALVHARTIGPGTADVARYRLTVPRSLAGTRLVVAATLRWRKFRRAYTEYAWSRAMPGRPVPDLPVTDLASGRAGFPVVDGPSAGPAPLPASALTEGWVRWNDWGIGLLLQGDTTGAETAFSLVRDALPDRVDGWRNLARAKLRDGLFPDALALLGDCESRDPGNPQTAYFFGLALEKSYRLEDAIAAYERARESFPGDRTIHRNLGRIRFRLEQHGAALRDFLEVLAIDPEDREAHYYRFLIYTEMGEVRAAAEAEKAYLKYQLDESAQKWTNAYRREHPHVNRESQPVHVHDLEVDAPGSDR